MNFQRVFALVKKDLKRLVREPAALFMIILFPAILTLTFGLAFGGVGGNQSATYQIGVVNEAPIQQNQMWTQYLIGNLTRIEILKIQPYLNNETAQVDLVQGKISAIILVPNDFEQSCDSYWRAPNDPSAWVNTTLQVYVDKGSMFATQAIQPIIQQALTETVYGQQTKSLVTPIQISSPSLVQTTITTTFEFFAPGLFAFSSIFLIMIVAQSFALDRESGLLRRINVTPTTATEFMSSQVISNMISAFIQAVLVFVMAYAVGYRPKGDAATMAVAFVLVLIFALSNVGFGLITATLAKSSGAATGIAFIFIMPQMFLGTFVGSALSATAQSVGKFVPSYYVTDALTSLFLRGAPVSSPTILVDIAVVSAVSITTLLVGILLFRKYGKA
ncbi:ABC transporter permease [Candidatus Bathyarchaeota archaeon]|nr:ABC transporter permease [Candidatus Bathyarchaeota archaeon]